MFPEDADEEEDEDWSELEIDDVIGDARCCYLTELARLPRVRW